MFQYILGGIAVTAAGAVAILRRGRFKPGDYVTLDGTPMKVASKYTSLRNFSVNYKLGPAPGGPLVSADARDDALKGPFTELQIAQLAKAGKAKTDYEV